ncbi:hypothetical protein DSO57_1018727 [Entomophthora muscae]|uniref:Uncharacterized protein n=1 Tax=Entomophthora muscae TaxID=34485 RepID=A0ACC2RIW1_9FUNG|nr:hypothetical protein DSO57_1018727 [Entomophthora muscae]
MSTPDLSLGLKSRLASSRGTAEYDQILQVLQIHGSSEVSKGAPDNQQFWVVLSDGQYSINARYPPEVSVFDILTGIKEFSLVQIGKLQCCFSGGDS